MAKRKQKMLEVLDQHIHRYSHLVHSYWGGKGCYFNFCGSRINLWEQFYFILKTQKHSSTSTYTVDTKRDIQSIWRQTWVGKRSMWISIEVGSPLHLHWLELSLPICVGELVNDCVVVTRSQNDMKNAMWHHTDLVISTVKHSGGSIMQWRCFFLTKKLSLVRDEGKMDAVQSPNTYNQTYKVMG